MSTYVRILKAEHFDPRRNRFVDLAFKPSSPARGGGISVFDYDCAGGTPSAACAHIARWYQDLSGQPAIFWWFTSAQLPNGSVHIEEEPSKTGDECHRNIHGLSAGRAKKFFKRVQGEMLFTTDCFQVCGPDGVKRLSLTELDAT